MSEVKDVNVYIDYIERMIVKQRGKGKNFFGSLEVKFEKDSMAENAKRYFRIKGYQVELTKCKQCSTHDFIISW